MVFSEALLPLLQVLSLSTLRRFPSALPESPVAICQKEAHVDVRQPYQREVCHQIASPVIEQQLVTGDEQEEGGDVAERRNASAELYRT
jgi:hypothetical protein